MRRFVFFLLAFCFLFSLAATNLFAGDTFNYDVTTDHKMKSRHIYRGTVDMSDDTTGNHYTKWFEIGEFTQNNAYVWAVCTEAGTEDVNVKIQYSMNGDSTAYGVTAALAIDGLDAVGATVPKVDTVNVVAGTIDVEYRAARYGRLLFDGQAGNGDTTVYWWYISERNPTYSDRPKGGTQINRAIIE